MNRHKKLIFLALVYLTSCAEDSASSGPKSVASCSDLGINDTWSGDISGHADTMQITTNCAVTSSYCQSNSTVVITQRNSSCSGGIAECGSMTFKTTSSNGNTGCAAVGHTYNCSFTINVANTSLKYDCGGGVISYTR